ncbi:patatin-like phospholipase family protein [Desulfurella sp.]|uniref:patatin-like phospholipase family protein n=1 Tax=Desulfurella sp. TaxID=1962857 RepID=UPI003D12C4E4
MKTVSLALSGGAARGYAHIGVIKELINNGFKINAIAATSMGAVVGAMFAANRLNEYEEWVRNLYKMDIIGLLDFSVGGGLVKTDKLFNVLGQMLGSNILIEDLLVKFCAVSVDIVNKKEVWFDKGDLLFAIKASSAIPSIFYPVEKDGHLYVDGGILNNLPVGALRNTQSDYVIAVDINSNVKTKYDITIQKDEEKQQNLLLKQFNKISKKFKKDQKKQYSIFDIAATSFDIMQNTLKSYRLAENKVDILIEIPQDVCKMYDFHKASQLIQIGQIATKNTLEFYKEKISI